jgi:hypothetical protein
MLLAASSALKASIPGASMMVSSMARELRSVAWRS